jgi:hypothetical protein
MTHHYIKTVKIYKIIVGILNNNDITVISLCFCIQHSSSEKSGYHIMYANAFFHTKTANNEV